MLTSGCRLSEQNTSKRLSPTRVPYRASWSPADLATHVRAKRRLATSRNDDLFLLISTTSFPRIRITPFRHLPFPSSALSSSNDEEHASSSRLRVPNPGQPASEAAHQKHTLRSHTITFFLFVFYSIPLPFCSYTLCLLTFPRGLVNLSSALSAEAQGESPGHIRMAWQVPPSRVSGLVTR